MKLEEKKIIDVLFVIPPFHKRNGSGLLFPLGIGAIMSYLDMHGLTYDYIYCPLIIDTLYPEDLKKLDTTLQIKLKEYEPALVGIGPCVTPGIRGLEIIAKCCLKIFGTERVFAGGPFTLLPSQEWVFYEHLNLSYIIKGDGEEAVFQAVKTIRSGRSLSQCELVSRPGHSKINVVTNINEMPFPKRVAMERSEFSDRRRYAMDGKKTAHIIASRGCPYHCAYCVSGNLKMPFRKRSTLSVVEEMKILLNQYAVSDIVFYDDCFFTSTNTVHREIEEFCIALEKSNLHLSWQIEIRPDILVEINDNELRRLSKLGCRQMNIGIEKTNNDGASVFGKSYDYAMLKNRLEHIHSITNIRMTGTFILGGKGETIASVREMIKASTEMHLDEAEFSPLFVYPDTPIYNDVFSDPKCWLDVVLSSEEPWGEVVYENEELDKKTVIGLVDEAYSCFYPESGATERIRDRYHLKG